LLSCLPLGHALGGGLPGAVWWMFS